MVTKDIKDYFEELAEYYPEMDEKEVKKIALKCSDLLRVYMRNWYRGVKIISKKSLVGDGVKERFSIHRIFGRKHLNSMKKAHKKFNK